VWRGRLPASLRKNEHSGAGTLSQYQLAVKGRDHHNGLAGDGERQWQESFLRRALFAASLKWWRASLISPALAEASASGGLLIHRRAPRLKEQLA